jgi:hypothetical protein
MECSAEIASRSNAWHLTPGVELAALDPRRPRCSSVASLMRCASLRALSLLR